MPPKGVSRKPKGSLCFSLGAHRETPGKTTKDFLWFSVGGPFGDSRKTEGFSQVFAGCSQRGAEGNPRAPLGFRWVPLGGASEKKNVWIPSGFRLVPPGGPPEKLD